MAPQMLSAASKLTFKVHRRQPELVSPATPTPREIKLLSHMDDQQGVLRFHVRLIFFYKYEDDNSNGGKNRDPVEVIRKALAETLVYYYPFAGRLREGSDQKLVVDCNGEGVMFIEADADVALDEFGDDLLPPFPCFEDLLFEVEGSSGILNSPLLLIQVTRLKCDGFILALRHNHAMADAAGLTLFLTTLSELARGDHAPSIHPVWYRHLLNPRVPARVTRAHEYDATEPAAEAETFACNDNVQRSFFFGQSDISALHRLLHPHQRERVTHFETLTSFIWRCRTAALKLDPNTEMRLKFIVNARPKLKNPPLPPGYYGNAIVTPVAISTANELTERPLDFTLRLVREARLSVTEDFFRSLADFLATNDQPLYEAATLLVVSDVRRSGLENVDFGFGKPLYGGLAEARAGDFQGLIFYATHKNTKGETGTVVLICLPAPAMERFEKEVKDVLSGGNCKNDFKYHFYFTA
ncbi:PREDICTED: (Z)-3-hexen-1-ol acetyltransferase-like [Tarenaya hassleriana]|uniref:(Z)-3-hexen-1-ol acetyltransferase-like n=1 Tax=Tarenaya hassleriana TaxID=28532 RepID=UPI00053C8355|nr:PREDICTED: (Z)-3-hexen-1-ol acetyltransferase-like [Tarenaya hassleriana]